MQRILAGKNVNSFWRAMSNCVLATLLRKPGFLKKVGVSTELRDVVYVDAGRVTQRDGGAPPKESENYQQKI